MIKNMFTNRIETFDSLEDAEMFISLLCVEAEKSLDYFKIELTLLPGRRWRIGVSVATQGELFDGFVE